MFNKTRSGFSWLAALLVIGVLGLTACTSTPLPPLFVTRGSAAVAPAAAAPMVATPVVAASEAETPSVGEAEAAAIQTAEAKPVSAAMTQTVELTATAAVAVEVRAAEAVTGTTPITSTAAITASRAVEVAVAAAPPTPTATRVAPTPTRRAPTATRARPTTTPTPQWPKTLVITSDDIEQGATSAPGLQISGLDVQFGNNTMTMRFDSLRYSFVSLRNVTIEGRFVVNNCDVDFVADRITPRNLATGAIPGFINQSLDQQLGAWCVESLAVQPGQLVATVRPR